MRNVEKNGRRKVVWCYVDAPSRHRTVCPVSRRDVAQGHKVGRKQPFNRERVEDDAVERGHRTGWIKRGVAVGRRGVGLFTTRINGRV